jgi:putative transposase
MRFQFIAAEKANYPIRMMCRVLEVSKSGFYQWLHGAGSPRSQADNTLFTDIRMIYQESRRTYGSPRVHASLRRSGHTVGKNRVARLMRQGGLRSCYNNKRRYGGTTTSNHLYEVAANTLERQFDVSAPNAVWVSDITYIRTGAGWLYLAAIVDLYSRAVVGWSMSNSLEHGLVKAALGMATQKREVKPGLLHHSDRGVQYAARGFQEALSGHEMVCSMSRKGDCWDNAVIESFFKTLKVELVHRSDFKTRQEAKAAIFEYIETFYNRQRLHSYLDYQSPAEYEEAYLAA